MGAPAVTGMGSTYSHGDGSISGHRDGSTYSHGDGSTSGQSQGWGVQSSTHTPRQHPQLGRCPAGWAPVVPQLPAQPHPSCPPTLTPRCPSPCPPLLPHSTLRTGELWPRLWLWVSLGARVTGKHQNWPGRPGGWVAHRRNQGRGRRPSVHTAWRQPGAHEMDAQGNEAQEGGRGQLQSTQVDAWGLSALGFHLSRQEKEFRFLS